MHLLAGGAERLPGADFFTYLQDARLPSFLLAFPVLVGERCRPSWWATGMVRYWPLFVCEGLREFGALILRPVYEERSRVAPINAAG